MNSHNLDRLRKATIKKFKDVGYKKYKNNIKNSCFLI